MKIQEAFIEPNKYSRPQIPLKETTKIAVHYTGCAGSSAMATRNYFNNLAKTGSRYVSSHFVVGLQGEVIQCIPLSEMSYCTNQANPYSISIEVCHPDNTGKFNDVTEKALAELCAYLLQKLELDADDIIRHYDVTGKQCPLYWSPTKYQPAETANARFEEFKNKVRALLDEKNSPDGGESKDAREEGNSFRVKIIDNALNIRKYPSITAPVTGVIRDCGVYTITETAHGGSVLWGRLKSGAGWISLGGKYVKRWAENE